MEIIKTEIENWMTLKLKGYAFNTTLVMSILLLIGSFIYQNDLIYAGSWMPASGELVFKQGEYWRLWTTLFAHGNFSHIFGNLFLFIPFAYFLTGQYGMFYFPLFGFFIGGIINFFVLKTMNPLVSLIGVSGVVYWMGATYMTLAYFIDNRDTNQKKFLKLSGISIILFFPESFKIEVSYLSHFIGFVLGIFSGGLLYYFFKNTFNKYKKYEYKIEFDEYEDLDCEELGLKKAQCLAGPKEL